MILPKKRFSPMDFHCFRRIRMNTTGNGIMKYLGDMSFWIAVVVVSLVVGLILRMAMR